MILVRMVIGVDENQNFIFDDFYGDTLFSKDGKVILQSSDIEDCSFTLDKRYIYRVSVVDDMP